MNMLMILDQALLLRRPEDARGGGFGCFVVLLIVGIVVFLVLRGRRDRDEQLGTAHRPMGSGPVDGFTFANPYPKCPTCGASGDKMKQVYDGLRKVTWTCGYCGATAGVQELKDEELPPGARQRLGLDAPQGMMPGQPGYYPPQGGGMGNLVTGMMLGSMLGGGSHERDRDGWGGQGGNSGGGGGDWGDGGGSGGDSGGDWGDSGGGGGDWGDSGGGDSGGSDF